MSADFWQRVVADTGEHAAGVLAPLAEALTLPTASRLALAHDSLVALATGAPFLCRLMSRDPEALVWLTADEVWQGERPAAAMAAHLAAVTDATLTEPLFMSRARRVRTRELARIAARDLLGLATVVESTLELSELADTLLSHACLFARRMADERFGPPLSPAFADARGFAILALGKLGASELNFSSDIDIVYLYAADGETAGGVRPAVTIQEWAVALARTLTRVIEEPNEDGRLFRVDLRLRPDGAQGPIACTPEWAAAAYARGGEPWQRVALLRARHAAGDAAVTSDLTTRLEPFTYGAVDERELVGSLRRIKEQLLETLELKHAPGFDLKLGKGGIRELEFFAQTLQLLHQRGRPSLRERRTFALFERLADCELLTRTLAESSSADYAFWRRVEHRLQMREDQQTHLVPRDLVERTSLAHGLGFMSVDAFDAAVEDCRERVHLLFQSLFSVEETAADRELRRLCLAEVATLVPEVARAALEALIERWPVDHLKRSPRGRLALGLTLVLELGPDRPVRTRVLAEDDGVLQVIVAAFDRTGLASVSSGVIAALGLDIVAGRLFTLPATSDGHACAVQYLTVKAARPELCRAPTPHALEERLGRTLSRWVAGLTEEVRGELNGAWVERMQEFRAGSPWALGDVEVELDNRADPQSSVVDVWAEDAPGFFHGFTQALAMRGIRVHQTLIRTDGRRALDRFYLTDAHGLKLVSAAARHELEVVAVLIKGFSHFLSRAADPARALVQFDLLLDRLGEEGVRAHLQALRAEPLLAALARVLGSGTYLFEDFLRLHADHMLPVLEALSVGSGAALSPPNEVGGLALRRRKLVAWRDAEVFRIDCEHLIRDDERFDRFAEELTFLAEGVLTRAWRYALEEVAAQLGEPKTRDGRALPWALCALGKFGGAELGVASDLELLVAYDDRAPSTAGSVTAQEYFARAVQALVHSLPTRKAGVFELDLRLRPHGQDGPLATSLSVFRAYYRPHGGAAAFERQALIRLRPFTGDRDLGTALEQARDAFTYGTEPFALAEALALRHRQLDELVQPGTVDLKLGLGGLVEIEYGVQYLQLVHGHAHPRVRATRTLAALKALEGLGVVGRAEAETLRRAYFLLRVTIDALRLERGSAKDTTLPVLDSHEAQVLGRRLAKSPLGLYGELGVTMAAVADIFRRRA